MRFQLSPATLAGLHTFTGPDDPVFGDYYLEDSDDPDPDWCACACPVCGEGCESVLEAAHCCLWKDLDWPTRYGIAREIENGSSWTEQLL